MRAFQRPRKAGSYPRGNCSDTGGTRAAIITGKVEVAEGIPERYRVRLAMQGVRVINGTVWFANNSILLEKALGKTQYADSIRCILLRSEGAVKSGKPISFSNVVSHAVGLPLSLLLR